MTPERYYPGVEYHLEKRIEMFFNNTAGPPLMNMHSK